MGLPLLTSTGTLCLVGGRALVDAVYVPGDVEFGALTLSGQGGAATTGTSIVSGNTNGRWTITDGKVVPTANVSTFAGEAPWTLTFNDASTMTITCPANVKHVDTLAQVQAALNQSVIAENSTIKVRGGNKNGPLAYTGRNAGLGPPPVFTLEAADPLDPPVFTEWGQPSGDPNGNYTLRNLKFDCPNLYNERSNAAGLNANGYPVLVENCEFSGTTVSSRENLGLIGQGYLVTLTGTGGITFRNCNIHHAAWGILVDGGAANITIENCEIHHVYADFIGCGGVSNCTIRNNRMHTYIGFGTIYHSDGIQFTDPAAPFRDITIEGNVIFPGDYIGNTLQTSKEDRGWTDVIVTSTMTLTTADHVSRRIRVNKPDGATEVILTLPPASECPQESIWFTAFADTTSSGSGADVPYILRGVDGGDVTVNFRNYEYYTRYGVRSDGTSWTTWKLGYNAGFHDIVADYTVKPRNNENFLLVDASAGNVTITLPATGTGVTEIAVGRVDDTANTVTVQTTGGETINFISGVPISGVTSCEVPPFQTAQFFAQSGSWNGEEGKYDNQGIFGNIYDYDRIIVRGNIVWSDSSHAFQMQGHDGELKVYNNTFIQPYHPDRNGDGVISPWDGPRTKPWVRLEGDPTVSNQLRFAANNFIATSLTLTDGGGAASYAQDNVVLDLVATGSAASTIAALDAALGTHVQGGGVATGAFAPTTIDQAIDALLAKSGGPLDGTYIGALGTTRSNGYWDFVTGQKNPSAPEPTIP